MKSIRFRDIEAEDYPDQRDYDVSDDGSRGVGGDGGLLPSAYDTAAAFNQQLMTSYNGE